MQKEIVVVIYNGVNNLDLLACLFAQKFPLKTFVDV
jgi:hypothetical protein